MKEETKAVFENLTFGTELEYEGITRSKAAEAICKALRKTWSAASIRYIGGGYDTWEIIHTTGTWKVTRDGSLLNGGAEVVTPVLHWENMPILQEVVRELRHAGAKATERGSQHVHIGIADFTALQLANMARIWYKQEDLFLKAAGTLERRIDRYCNKMNSDFVQRLNKLKGKCTLPDLNRAWFGTDSVYAPHHYDLHRYHSFNMNNIWREIKTVEFRLFNATTHAGEVKANIALCLAVSTQAILKKRASARNPYTYCESCAKYDMRVRMIELDLIGDEFENVRMHLTKRLTGTSAKSTRAA